MQEEIIMKYTAIWGWQIISLMFLIASLIFFALPRTLTTSSFYVAFFLIFAGCEFVTLKRKRELTDAK